MTINSEHYFGCLAPYGASISRHSEPLGERIQLMLKSMSEKFRLKSFKNFSIIHENKPKSWIASILTDFAMTERKAFFLSPLPMEEGARREDEGKCTFTIAKTYPSQKSKIFTLPQGEGMKIAFTLAEVLITLGIIGVVAALTLPNLINEYKKQETVARLKKTYSVLSQAVTLSVKDNGEIENWNFDLEVQEFMDKYLSGYFQNIVRIKDPSIVRYSKSYFLADGTMFQGWMFKNPRPEAYNVTTFFKIYADINGDKKPNQYGRDKFIFYIFPKAQNVYNTGLGDCAAMVPAGGLYSDGYGYDRERLLNDTWRGCDMRYNDEALGKGTDLGAFCTALIMMDGWNINYKW